MGIKYSILNKYYSFSQQELALLQLFESFIMSLLNYAIKVLAYAHYSKFLSQIDRFCKRALRYCYISKYTPGRYSPIDISYVGMCRPKGYVFFSCFGLKSGMIFKETRERHNRKVDLVWNHVPETMFCVI